MVIDEQFSGVTGKIQAAVKQDAYAPGDVGVCLFSEGGNMKVSQVKGWEMASSNLW